MGRTPRLLSSALAVALSALLPTASPARAEPARTLADRMKEADGVVPAAADPLPKLPACRRGKTPHYDVSTTLGKDVLVRLVRAAERTRAVLEHHLAIRDDEPPIGFASVPVVVCAPGEYADVLERLGVPRVEVLKGGSAWNFFHDGVLVVKYDAAPKEEAASLDRFVNLIALTELTWDTRFRAVDRMPWLLDGIGYFVTHAVVGTTMNHTTARGAGGGGRRSFATKEDLFRGDGFNPDFLTAQIRQKADADLRAEMAKSLAEMTAEDSLKAYFFATWLFREADADGTRVRRWLESAGRGEVEDRLKEAFALDPTKPAYEDLDAKFRAHHVAKHPPGKSKPGAKKDREKGT